jgi:hypothetical protein
MPKTLACRNGGHHPPSRTLVWVHAIRHTFEGAVAFLVLGVAYALVSARFTVGPPWLLLVIAAPVYAIMVALYQRGLLRARRLLGLMLTALATVAIGLSAAFLLSALLVGRAEAGDLLISAALLWLSNVLVFALWYWEVDAGGPHQRHIGPVVSTDFLFPQMVGGEEYSRNWCPEFLDYFFLAFNTSTAFSPTDTMFLARRAKVLMMLQAVISLVTIAVFAARAINTLPS